MRTTIRIADDLLDQLREQAQREKLPLTQLLDRTLRAGIRASSAGRPRRSRYREETHALGAPRVDTEKALALAAALEDAEIARKMALRK